MNIGSGVRSLAWDLDGVDLYVGSIDSALFLFKEVLER